MADSTIPDHEERMVTADVTEWILEHEEFGGRLPTLTKSSARPSPRSSPRSRSQRAAT
ncbi:hypothetical protein GTX14_18690 [Streptomyces sp. SID4944]|nr:hypothetical protein [Streptomyces sp. SID4944]